MKLNYCSILESRRRGTGQHKPNVLNMAVGCANAGSDMLAPAPAWLIRGPTNGHTAETNNLKLAHTPALGSEPSPTMASKQTNGTSGTASCAVAS